MTYRDKLLELFNVEINKIIIDKGIEVGYQILLFNKFKEDFDIINVYLQEGGDYLPDKFLIDLNWWEFIMREFDNDSRLFALTLSDYVKELIS
ncbi:hypothetical protein LCGC14_0667090 [marine sediment metagenome]|uniref:Uncharacterized protein n=1 Tax=marine sediment metagenome TaxID=412755 RepID=A0A0F9RC39_9ZZZZ